MKITDTVQSLNSKMDILSQLEDPEYIEANGITPEEVETFKAQLEEELMKDKGNLASLAEYLLQRRETRQILVDGAIVQEERIKKTRTFYENSVKRLDKALLWIMQTLGEEKLETSMGRISVKKSDKMVVLENGVNFLPAELTKYSVNMDVDPGSVESLKEMFGITAEKGKTSLTEIKKRYKGLSEEEKEDLKLKGIYIDDTPSVTIK